MLGLTVALLVLVSGGFFYRSFRQHEAAGSLVVRFACGIDDGRFVRISGREQWIQISGENHRNPVLLILHGGLGAS
nr:hypothetical protein [uncultured Lichenicoccus sp.]